jgi:UDP-glucose 4-epimerase
MNKAGLGYEPVRAIVTGGAGFIGSHVVRALLDRGDDVHVVDDLSNGKRENLPDTVPLTVADIREPLRPLFDEVRPGLCFHLAAQADVRVSVERPEYDADVNVLGTIRVLEAARAHDAQVVLSSTGGAIYGECAEPAPETAERQPLAPYGASKLCGEEYLATYNRLYGTRHVALRYGNVYGPRQDPHGEAGVVAIFLGRLARGETPRIFGDGRQTRDYVYAGDVARATLAAAGHDGGVFNVGTGIETSVLELYDACRRVAGVDVQPEMAEARLGELQRSVLDVSLAERELGWRPEYSLEQGLRATWESIAGAQESVRA